MSRYRNPDFDFSDLKRIEIHYQDWMHRNLRVDVTSKPVVIDSIRAVELISTQWVGGAKLFIFIQ